MSKLLQHNHIIGNNGGAVSLSRVVNAGQYSLSISRSKEKTYRPYDWIKFKKLSFSRSKDLKAWVFSKNNNL